jgi:hypothetical protein
MLPSRRSLLRNVACVAGAVLCIGVISGAQSADKESPAVRREPLPLTANQKLLKFLEQPFETKIFEAPAGHSLKEFIGQLYDAASKRGIDAPVLIDFEAFKNDNPDVYKEPGDLYDIRVTIPQVPRELPLGVILQIAISKIPTNNAAFYVHQGYVDVTTVTRAAPAALMQAGVSAVFVQRPLASAVQQLADSTGVTIIVDPRMGKADTPVTATFNNGVPLKTALALLANMAGHEVIEVPGALYLTTVENARAFRMEHKARQQEENWRRKNNLPEANPPVQPKSDTAGV